MLAAERKSGAKQMKRGKEKQKVIMNRECNLEGPRANLLVAVLRNLEGPQRSSRYPSAMAFCYRRKGGELMHTTHSGGGMVGAEKGGA